jgi:hypothetical protein
MKKRGYGQSWSLDIILAFVIFALIIGIFYTVLSKNNPGKTENLQREADVLSNNLDSSTGLNTSLSVIEGGTVDEFKLQELYNSSYQSLKSQFGIRGDFCVYVVDQYGNLITVNTSQGELVGFGNGNLTINGKACGTTIN